MGDMPVRGRAFDRTRNPYFGIVAPDEDIECTTGDISVYLTEIVRQKLFFD